MNSKDPKAVSAPKEELSARPSVLAHYQLEDIQHLKEDELAAVQQLSGHGSTLGKWETPSARGDSQRNISLAKRISDYLNKLHPNRGIADASEKVVEAAISITRIGLLLGLAPVAGRKVKVKDKPLKANTVASAMYSYWPQIAALALTRKDSSNNPTTGLFCHLTADDVAKLSENEFTEREINRLFNLADLGLWHDIPERHILKKVTSPSTKPAKANGEKKKIPYAPLPMQWLSEIGPRVLWVVNELAPNLLRLLENLRDRIDEERDLTGNSTAGKKLKKVISESIASDPWLDSKGQPLMPPFDLKTASRSMVDNFEWPIRTWENVLSLSTLVQAAHGFIALLATAGRVGEVSRLTRGCIEVHADGSAHSHGATFKLNWSPQGMPRTWPAPEMLVKALGQQAQLAAAWDWLPTSSAAEGVPTARQFGNQLWISIGSNGFVGPGTEMSFPSSLLFLAIRLGVDPKPGGKNVHPHRFRKSVAMLAGVALWNSPLVLKQLLGHKAIEMTLHYILSDPGIREEAEKVLRELRVMHCAETFAQVREAVKSGLPNPFDGKGGARLVVAVTEFENREEQSGRVVTQESLVELATQYTMNGRAWRLGWGFICSKLPHEGGECQAGASRRGEHGEPLISNCKRSCTHRIDLAAQIHQAREKRDVEANCELYVRTAKEACDGGQLLVANDCLRRMYELLAEWPDLKAHFDARSDVKTIADALMEEPEMEAVDG